VYCILSAAFCLRLSARFYFFVSFSMELSPEGHATAAFRAFFFGIYAAEPARRRSIVKQWNFSKVAAKKQRVADVLAHVISSILYEPVAFKMRADHFCLLGNGEDMFSVRYALLDQQERNFIVGAFARRTELFSTVKMFPNNLFSCDKFKYDSSGPGGAGYTSVFDPIWKREIVRDFVWILLDGGAAAAVGTELIAAMQSLLLEHKHGRQDVFLSALHSGVQGTTNVRLVPCWGLDARDRHSEDVYQQKIRDAEQQKRLDIKQK
jgi:hypothetical protein